MKHTLITLLAASLMVGCGQEQQKTTNQQEEGILTKTEQAFADKIQLTEEFVSEILPYKKNDITPSASGVHIQRIMVEVGDKVQKGQLLLTLDPTRYNQQRVQLQTLEDDYQRLLPVYEAGGISRQQIDQAKASLDIQREIVADLKKNIEVHAPISGVVTQRNYESGDLFAQQPILTLMQINPLKVSVHISEQYFRNVKVGMPIELGVDIFPDKKFMGRVELIYPAMDAATRTFEVEVRIPNSELMLRPGMYANSTFNMGEKQGVMVPDIAVRKQTGTAERYLYVIKEGVAHRRRVEVGRQKGAYVDILSGVSVDEHIAITALTKLYDGAKVRIQTNEQQ